MIMIHNKNSDPILSVIIPAYNAERWIKDAIESTINCTKFPTEIIVVDDGSTDETAKIASGYGHGIRVIRQRNSGVVRARQRGVESAHGQYIKMLDADDLLPRGCLDSLLAVAEKYPDDIFLGRVAAFSNNTEDLDEGMYSIGYQPGHLELLKKEFLLTQATPSGAWLIPRRVFLEHAIFDRTSIQLGEEYLFCKNIIESQTPVRHINNVVYLARNHESPCRLSNSRIESRHIAQARMIQQSYNYIINNIPSYSPEAISILAKLCWSRGRECLRINCQTAARDYFELSKKIDHTAILPGSAFYRCICSVMGPYLSETLLQACKRILTRRKKHGANHNPFA